MFGLVGIKWVINSIVRREIVIVMDKKRGSFLYLKFYVLVDVLKMFIYFVIFEFYEEMLVSVKLGFLEKDWVNNGKFVYGFVEFLA